MDMEEALRTFGVLVVAGVVWVLLMIFAVIRGFFKETTVLALFVASGALGGLGALVNVYAAHREFLQFEFLYYFAFWWVVFGVMLTIIPAVLHIRRHMF
ncbi:hypothetical protein [Falsiroseomonas oryziterrae]|uniref:hypothetical protein n=1 Tax=Falsiroseomonas oryziterrae TaxID=2911368 RepID=UPI001F4186E5|nr:hypothetical protein [Roseomonas sp. NPKOSM-4]